MKCQRPWRSLQQGSRARRRAWHASAGQCLNLLLDGLKDIYYAEKKILKALPKMAKGAQGKEFMGLRKTPWRDGSSGRAS